MTDEMNISERVPMAPERSSHPMPLQNHENSACRRSCCWTPFGHSGAVLMCACHGSIGEWAQYVERAK